MNCPGCGGVEKSCIRTNGPQHGINAGGFQADLVGDLSSAKGVGDYRPENTEIGTDSFLNGLSSGVQLRQGVQFEDTGLKRQSCVSGGETIHGQRSQRSWVIQIPPNWTGLEGVP